jgi:four helix bundle protein
MISLLKATKNFPMGEKYSLTDQIRRSSRSVRICLIEAYRKKKYELHFVAKVGDSDMENSETCACLDFSLCLIFLYNKRVPHL